VIEMPIYRGENDGIEGDKIYCVFRKSTKPVRVTTGGRHNAQAITIEGNPAKAVIVKVWRFKGER